MATAGTRLLQLTIDGVDYMAQVGKCTVSATPSEERAICEPQCLDYFLNLALVVDHAPGSLWRKIFDSAGERAEIVFMPYGNAEYTHEQPHYVGTATILEPVGGDLMGTVANRGRRRRQSIEVQWPFSEKPRQLVPEW